MPSVRWRAILYRMLKGLVGSPPSQPLSSDATERDSWKRRLWRCWYGHNAVFFEDTEEAYRGSFIVGPNPEGGYVIDGARACTGSYWSPKAARLALDQMFRQEWGDLMQGLVAWLNTPASTSSETALEAFAAMTGQFAMWETMAQPGEVAWLIGQLRDRRVRAVAQYLAVSQQMALRMPNFADIIGLRQSGLSLTDQIHNAAESLSIPDLLQMIVMDMEQMIPLVEYLIKTASPNLRQVWHHFSQMFSGSTRRIMEGC